MLSPGQQIALNQINTIAEIENGAIKLLEVEDKKHIDDPLVAYVALDCTSFSKVEDGFPLRARECVRITIPKDFPFKIPSIDTPHTRFKGRPHVQWGCHLCIYLSEETQWIPSEGMFGLLRQLDEWFRRAALNELDAVEGPIHPPVAYRELDAGHFCINANVPGFEGSPWLGYALLKKLDVKVEANAYEVNGWHTLSEIDDEKLYAPSILLDFELSFEFPRTVSDLLDELEAGGVNISRFLIMLMRAAKSIERDQKLYVCIGTPSRGVVGDIDNRQQHLSFWEISEADVLVLNNALLAIEIDVLNPDSKSDELESLLSSVWNSFNSWKQNSKIRWCDTVENRPEIIIPRDQDASINWFKGKRVALWGAGALGSVLSEQLIRAGVSSIDVFDNKAVTPGLLVRQNYKESDFLRAKVRAIKTRLNEINSEVTVNVHPENLITATLAQPGWADGIDVIIDTTASLRVRSKLELLLQNTPLTIPVVSMMVSGAVKHGVAVVVNPEYEAGVLDVYRRLGLACANRKWLDRWVKAFWSTDPSEPTRQPEPGCSDPTFVGSHADVSAMSGKMINAIAKNLAEVDVGATGFLFSNNNIDSKDYTFSFSKYIRIIEDGIDFRINPSVWRDIQGWINAGARERSAEDETGGLLFGAFDEVLNIAWITHVSGPPEDSEYSPEKFVCGVTGVKDLCNAHDEMSNGAVTYIGTWHSHPVSRPEPSETDFSGIGTLFDESSSTGRHQLMLIAGYASKDNKQIGLYAFEKLKFISDEQISLVMLGCRGGVIDAPEISPVKEKIGLALSGGGSRAVAFHLGTLRALNDLKLLESVVVTSGVSGGSVMTGLLGYSDSSFEEIDDSTVIFLKHGLVNSSLRKLSNPMVLLKLFAVQITSTVPSIFFSLILAVVGKVSLLVPGLSGFLPVVQKIRWPVPRWYTRTHLMADGIADYVGEGLCNSPTRDDMSVVFNACELRTGTAFRMSNERFGSWRFGWADSNTLRIADAIAASAAYPPFLPPFDWRKKLTKHGKTLIQRVVVTDGGVYENLGVSVMEPDRNAKFSQIKYSPEIIISSDAGAGQFSGDSIPLSWGSRMIQVVNSVMRKVQDATKGRLHEYAKSGSLKRFVYIGLGQLDEEVKLKNSKWISRELVMDYPTDFSAMTENDIRQISNRGETIARALLSQYLLSD